MKLHGLLLNRHAGGVERRHDGRIMLDERNRRWCSDGFDIGCDNGEKVRVAFALDCCDREAMSVLATTGGIRGEDVRDLMVAAIEHRFGSVNRLPVTIEWLTDKLSAWITHYSEVRPHKALGYRSPREFQLAEAPDRVWSFRGYNIVGVKISDPKELLRKKVSAARRPLYVVVLAIDSVP